MPVVDSESGGTRRQSRQSASVSVRRFEVGHPPAIIPTQALLLRKMRCLSCIAFLSLAASQCLPKLPSLGCFNDDSGPHVVSYLGGGPSLSMTLEMCTEICYADGFGLIGMTGAVCVVFLDRFLCNLILINIDYR